jgi:hypothetical protein
MDRWIRVLVTTAVILVTFGMEVRAADVPYISGGTGVDERTELLAKEKEYNLKIIGAAKSGDYLADVKVVIESAKNERVLDTTMDGRFSGRAGAGDVHHQGHIWESDAHQTVTIAGQDCGSGPPLGYPQVSFALRRAAS